MTQRIKIDSISGNYDVAVQCGANEPFVLHPGGSAEVNIWPGQELRVYEIGLTSVDQPELLPSIF